MFFVREEWGRHLIQMRSTRTGKLLHRISSGMGVYDLRVHGPILVASGPRNISFFDITSGRLITSKSNSYPFNRIVTTIGRQSFAFHLRPFDDETAQAEKVIFGELMFSEVFKDNFAFKHGFISRRYVED